MNKRTVLNLIVLVLVVICAGVSYKYYIQPPDVMVKADLSAFPANLGDWRGEEVPIGKQIQKGLNADAILSKHYTDSTTGNGMGLLVVYRTTVRRDFYHRPELCYPAAGWTIESKSTTTVPYGGKSIKAIKIIAQKDWQREVVVYWFASGPRTEENFKRQQMLMALDRFQPIKYGWAFVRLNAQVTDSDDATLKTIREFATNASMPMLDALTGKSKSSAKAPQKARS